MTQDHKRDDRNEEDDKKIASSGKAEANRDHVGFVGNRVAPVVVPAKTPNIRMGLSFKRDPVPALLAKEQDCCNRATD